MVLHLHHSNSLVIITTILSDVIQFGFKKDLRKFLMMNNDSTFCCRPSGTLELLIHQLIMQKTHISLFCYLRISWRHELL
jgi:hypothetical protein